MDNKEQARIKAETEHTKAGHKGYYAMIVNEDDRFTVRFGGCLQDIRFPFTDLKDGDLCVIKLNKSGIHYPAFYLNEGFCKGQPKDNITSNDIYWDVTLVKKTGFNILEHLEGEK